MSDATDAPTVKDQYDEVCREVRQRERLYPRWIAEIDRNGRPRITEETAARKLAAMQAAARTLLFVHTHAAGLRALAHFLMASTDPAAPDPPTPEERAALLGHPGVRNVLAAFPDAQIAGLTTPAAPTQSELFAEPMEETA